VAVAERDGPEAGLVALDDVDHVRLADFQPYHATRADLLARTGRHAAATAAYDAALGLTTNPIEARFLEGQRARVGDDTSRE
jgi:RNA polymerase sigma-70 factor (ECF subfamily)